MQLDHIDKRLLDIIQNQFPLSVEPYKDIALMLDMSEENVIERLKNLKDNRIIRRMGAVFDSSLLGYNSTLCAMEVSHQRIEEVAQIVNEYDGVTHNYLRDDKYNMWFTITARSKLEIDKITSDIKRKSGVQNLINLPAIHTFKIEVKFSMSDDQERTSTALRQHQVSQTALSRHDQEIIKRIQGNVALCSNPFQSISDELAITENDLVMKLKEMKDKGIIRRFGAVLHHKSIGMEANAMGIWYVPDERTQEYGAIMAAFPQISHCYQRGVTSDWHYNVYTMIHGKSVDDCEHVARDISLKTGVTDYRLLYSIRELKKSTMSYFTEKGSEL